MVVRYSKYLVILAPKDLQPIQYFSTVIAEHYEEYKGGSYEEDLLSGAIQACPNELRAISKGHNPHTSFLFLTTILQFAQRSREVRKDRFLNMPSASCLCSVRTNHFRSFRWQIIISIDQRPRCLSLVAVAYLPDRMGPAV